MRRALGFFTLLATIATAACSGSSTGPSSVGGASDISGNWTGTFTSSNNPSADITATIAQNGSAITGTWSASSVSWTGQVTGTMDGSTFNGTLAFAGTTTSQTVCTGNATVTGAATQTTLTLTSNAGVVGPSCPAALPVGIQISLHR